MKRLLSILAAVGLTATAASSVVACGSSKSDSDNGLTKNILGGNLGINAADVMHDLENENQLQLIFGDEGSALKTFTNYAAEAFMAHSDLLKKRVDDYTKTNADAASYVNDGMWDAIKNDWSTRKSNADDAWNKQIDDAKSNDGKKWKSKLFDSLKSQFGEYIYNSDNKRVKASSYTDYKDLYISYQILNGQSNSTSLSDSLKNDIYLWGTAPDGDSPENLKAGLISNVFKKKDDLKVGDKTVNFASHAKRSQGVPTDAAKRADTWFGQMDNYINGVLDIHNKNKDKVLSGDDKVYTDYLVNMINITGGYNIEEQLGTPADRAKFLIGNVQWATEDNLFATGHITSDSVTEWSNKLIQRFDDKFADDFGDKANTAIDANPSSLLINGNYDFTSEMGTIYSTPGKTTTTQINGLYSNSQRFVANDYYEQEKPVAISEIVVKPLYSNGKALDQYVTNTGYVGTDMTQMNNFYRFLGNFIDNKLTLKSGNFDDAKTNTMADGTSKYSWDSLMEAGVGKVADVTGQSWDSTFNGNVSFKEHSNLLTRDSSSSDYSDILKYSVYDYLQKGDSAPTISLNELKANDATPFNISEAQIQAINTGSAADNLDVEYNTISGLLDKLSRTETTGSMYQVVNKDQGIIAFTDADGIHFVRVEGFKVLKDAKADKQSSLSIDEFKKDETADKAKNQYHSAQLLASELGNDNLKKQAIDITNDYTDANISSQASTSLKYSDLNTGFGNKYLQFLANTSIPKSNGASDTKYSYDLNSLLTSYSTGDITSDNIQKSTNMLLMTWNYLLEITGWSDEQLFEFVANDGKVSDDNNKKSLLFDVLRNTNLNDNEKMIFKDAYKEYILGGLGITSNNTRDNSTKDNFTNAFKTADINFAKGTWKEQEPGLEAFRPSETFAKANKAADDNWYSDQSEALETNDKWKAFAPQVTKAFMKRSSLKVDSIKYKVDMSKFVVNSYVAKVGEE